MHREGPRRKVIRSRLEWFGSSYRVNMLECGHEQCSNGKLPVETMTCAICEIFEKAKKDANDTIETLYPTSLQQTHTPTERQAQVTQG